MRSGKQIYDALKALAERLRDYADEDILRNDCYYDGKAAGLRASASYIEFLLDELEF